MNDNNLKNDNWQKPLKYSLVGRKEKNREFNKWNFFLKEPGKKLGKVVPVVDTVYDRKVTILHCQKLYSFAYSKC